MYYQNCVSLHPTFKAKTWHLTDTDLCPGGETRTMSHIVESCLLPSWTVVCLSFTLMIILLFPCWPTMGLNCIRKKKKKKLKLQSRQHLLQGYGTRTAPFIINVSTICATLSAWLISRVSNWPTHSGIVSSASDNRLPAAQHTIDW